MTGKYARCKVSGFETVVDSLDIQRLDATSRVSDKQPVSSGHIANRNTHQQESRPGCSQITVYLRRVSLRIGLVNK